MAFLPPPISRAVVVRRTFGSAAYSLVELAAVSAIVSIFETVTVTGGIVAVLKGAGIAFVALLVLRLPVVIRDLKRDRQINRRLDELDADIYRSQ